jgi:hypothetical protein
MKGVSFDRGDADAVNRVFGRGDPGFHHKSSLVHAFIPHSSMNLLAERFPGDTTMNTPNLTISVDHVAPKNVDESYKTVVRSGWT